MKNLPLQFLVVLWSWILTQDINNTRLLFIILDWTLLLLRKQIKMCVSRTKTNCRFQLLITFSSGNSINGLPFVNIQLKTLHYAIQKPTQTLNCSYYYFGARKHFWTHYVWWWPNFSDEQLKFSANTMPNNQTPS